MSNIQNLWPATIGNTNIVMPKEVLLKQAQYLAEMTKNLLKVQVKTVQGVQQGKDEKILVHEFIVIAPTMGNYQFTLLRVMHDFSIYPVRVYDALEEKSFSADKEETFTTILSSIFSNRKTQNAINAIISQSI